MEVPQMNNVEQGLLFMNVVSSVNLIVFKSNFLGRCEKFCNVR